MEFTVRLNNVMVHAVTLAKEGRHSYFMPEHMIYGLTFAPLFAR